MKVTNEKTCQLAIAKLKALNLKVEDLKSQFQKLENEVIEYYGKILKVSEIIEASTKFYNEIYGIKK